MEIKLQGVRIHVKDVPATLAFYREKVGIDATAEMLPDQSVGVLRFGENAAFFVREQDDSGTLDAVPAGGWPVELVFVVDDVDACHRRLVEQGVRMALEKPDYVAHPDTKEPMTRRTRAFDPNGHLLTLVEFVTERGEVSFVETETSEIETETAPAMQAKPAEPEEHEGEAKPEAKAEEKKPEGEAEGKAEGENPEGEAEGKAEEEEAEASS